MDFLRSTIVKYRQTAIEVLPVLIFFIFSWFLMSIGLSYFNNTFHISGKIWSDFAAHLPMIRSFSMGNNFPPEYPSFPGEPIRYHFLFYMLVGLMEKAGLPIVFALNILSSVGFALMLSMIFFTTRLIFKSGKAGFLAVVLTLFNGSLTFVHYFMDRSFRWQSIVEIISLRDFVSFAPWGDGDISAFWNLNIYTNQRHLALSFGFVLLVVYPLLKHIIDRSFLFSKKWSVLVVLLFCFLPLLHHAGYVVALLFSFFLLLYIAEFSSLMSKTYITAFLISATFFVHFFQSTLLGAGANESLITIGFLASDTSIAGLLTYWFNNIGLYLVGIPIFFVWLKNNYFSEESSYVSNGVILFFFLFLVLFILANIFQLSTDIINNHKLFNFFLLGMSMGFSGMLVWFYQKSAWNTLWLLPVVLGLTLSGIIDFFPVINANSYDQDDYQLSDTASWIKVATDPQSVFVTTNYIHNPASLVGRKSYLDYGYFAWSMGYPDLERRKNLPTIFDQFISREKWCDFVKLEDIDYILISDQPEIDDQLVFNSLIWREFDPVAVGQDGNKVYSVARECGYDKN